VEMIWCQALGRCLWAWLSQLVYPIKCLIATTQLGLLGGLAYSTGLG
jgi:hypothetical protein